MRGLGSLHCWNLWGLNCHRFRTFSLNLYATISFFFLLALFFHWDRDLNSRDDSNTLRCIFTIHDFFQSQFKILALRRGASMPYAEDSSKWCLRVIYKRGRWFCLTHVVLPCMSIFKQVFLNLLLKLCIWSNLSRSNQLMERFLIEAVRFALI